MLSKVTDCFIHMIIQELDGRLFDAELPNSTFTYNEENIEDYVVTFLQKNPGLIPLIEQDLEKLENDEEGNYYEDCLYHMIHHGLENRIITEIVFGNNKYITINDPCVDLKTVLLK
jgi:hypothetical protein